MTFKEIVQRWGHSTFAHVASSFILMGGWAVFANKSHTMPAPLYAGLLQGTLSAIITLGVKTAFEASFRYWSKRGQLKTGLIVTPLTVCSVSATSLLICHAIAGTPELIATIIIPSSVALFYGYTYTYAMYRQARSALSLD